MTSALRAQRILGPLAVVLGGVLVLAGCSVEPEPLPVAGAIIVGTTNEVSTLDPAGELDRGSLLVIENVYPQLLTTVPGSDVPVPDIAASAEFTSPTEFTVVLKSGLWFANGNSLSSSDVKFSFDRVAEIGAERGLVGVFDRISGVEAVDEVTVVFTLRKAFDELWPVVLASPAAAIVDEEVFAAGSVTDNASIVKGQPFAGQFVVETFREQDLVQLRVNPLYEGALGDPLTDTVNLRFYGNPANLLRAVRSGDVDVATRGFSAENIESVESVEHLVVHTEPGSEMRFLGVDPALAPFGSSTAGSDAVKALAVRQAIAELVDRSSLVSELYAGAYETLWSFAPASVRPGDELAALYGAVGGGPDVASATQRFRDAGISPPVELSIHFSAELYGGEAGEELDWVRRQLSQGGLFDVELVPMDEADFEEGFADSGFPVFAGSFFPSVFDAEAYIEALFGAGSVLGSRFELTEVQSVLDSPSGGDSGVARADVLAEGMRVLAERVPIVPLLQGNHVVIANTDLAGVEEALAGSQLLRFAFLSK